MSDNHEARLMQSGQVGITRGTRSGEREGR